MDTVKGEIPIQYVEKLMDFLKANDFTVKDVSVPDVKVGDIIEVIEPCRITYTVIK